MAAIRPVVLVFQEFATPTVTPTTPDLNCLIVGPAYFIQDYFKPGTTDYADKNDIKLSSDYGQLEAPVGTATPVDPDVIVKPSNSFKKFGNMTVMKKIPMPIPTNKTKAG